MGCGTGVLAIVAAKRGAATVDAVDIDEWAEANCRENAAANGLAERIAPMLGDVSRIAGRKYDFIAANINRNILTMDMPAYAEALDTGGDLLMSGFLEEDVPVIEARARACGLEPVEVRRRDGWAMVHVKKACGAGNAQDIQGAGNRAQFAQVRRQRDGRAPADRRVGASELHGAGCPQQSGTGFETGVVPADVRPRIRRAKKRQLNIVLNTK